MLKLKALVAAAILALSPLVAQASTVVDVGNLLPNKSYNAGNVNIGASAYSFVGNIFSGTGGFTANTYVSPFHPTGVSTAMINFFVKGSRFKALSGSWGGNALTFSKVIDPVTNAISYVAGAKVTFSQAGLAGAQLFKLNWTGGNDIKFQVDLAAVPVPATGLLLAGAVAGLGSLLRRRRVAAAV